MGGRPSGPRCCIIMLSSECIESMALVRASSCSHSCANTLYSCNALRASSTCAASQLEPQRAHLHTSGGDAYRVVLALLHVDAQHLLDEQLEWQRALGAQQVEVGRVALLTCGVRQPQRLQIVGERVPHERAALNEVGNLHTRDRPC
jgi:hypothetical protein